MLVGVYIGQYCITTLTWFFIQLVSYLPWPRTHMYRFLKWAFAAALPGCAAGVTVIGGVISYKTLQQCVLSRALRARLLSWRGMALSMTMIGCNYAHAQSLMLLLMSISFFGKGIGALGWTVISDTSPAGLVGLNGALFNLIGNMAGITTPPYYWIPGAENRFVR